MARRLELHDILKGFTENVYFQPPSNISMAYPCIVYQRDSADSKFAGNKMYRYTQRYAVTIIDKSPDSEIPEKVAALPLCLFNRHFVADNLNHDVYVLYF